VDVKNGTWANDHNPRRRGAGGEDGHAWVVQSRLEMGIIQANPA
jgi:hypothetical protein